MVKAVNMDERPNTLGNPPKKSNPAEVTIVNPDDDVEFVVETGSDDLNIDAVVFYTYSLEEDTNFKITS